MDTLLRTLKLTLMAALVMGVVPQVNAQTPPDASRVFFNFSIGGQANDQTFTDSETFRIYNEEGVVASAHSIGGGTLFDFTVGARVRQNLGVGIGYSTVTNRNDAAVSARVPHPLVFGQPRTATATASELKHSEKAVHLQFMWTVPLSMIPLMDRFQDKFQLTVMGGPSFFTVRQTVASVQASRDISDAPPFTSVTINTVSLTDLKDSPVGVNIGVDGTYLVRTIRGVGIGVGGFVRYAGASLDLDTPGGVTRDTDLRTGGPQGGIGLRFRY